MSLISETLRTTVKSMIDDLCIDAYNEGVDAGKALPAARGQEALAQINRMARQIEECHATIRNRNERIKNLERELKTLKDNA